MFDAKKMSLLQLVNKYNLTIAAKKLGVTPAAILKALNSGRKIYVEEKPRSIVAHEIKPFPGRAKK